MANKHKTGTDYWDRDWHGNFTHVGGVKYGDGLLTRPGFAPGHFNERPIATMTDRGGSKVTSKFYLKSGAEGVASMAGRTNTMLPPTVGGGMVNRRNSGLTGWSRGLFLTGSGSKLPWEHVNSLLGTSRLGHSASERFRLNRDEESRRVSLQRVTKDGWVNAKVSDVISDKDELARSGLSPDTDISSSYSPKPRKGARLLNYSEDVSGMLNGVSDRGRVVTVENERLADKIKSFGDGLQNVIKLALDKVREASAESGKTAGGQVPQSNGDNTTPSAKRAKDTANVTAQLIGKAVRHPIDFLSTMSKGLISGFAKNNTALAMSNRFLRRFGIDLRMIRGLGMPGLIGGAAFAGIQAWKTYDSWERGVYKRKGAAQAELADRQYELEYSGITAVQQSKLTSAAAKYGLGQKEIDNLGGKIFSNSTDYNEFDQFAQIMGKAGVSVRHGDGYGNMLQIGGRIKKLKAAWKNNQDPIAYSQLNELKKYLGGTKQLNALDDLVNLQSNGGNLGAQEKQVLDQAERSKAVAERMNQAQKLLDYIKDQGANDSLDGTQENSFWTTPKYGVMESLFNWTGGWGGTWEERTHGLAEKVANLSIVHDADLEAGKSGAIQAAVDAILPAHTDSLREQSSGALGRFRGFSRGSRLGKINEAFKNKTGRYMNYFDLLGFMASEEGNKIDNDVEAAERYAEKVTYGALYTRNKEDWNKNPDKYEKNSSVLDNPNRQPSIMAGPGIVVDSYFSRKVQTNASAAKDAASSAMQSNVSKAKDAAESGQEAVGNVVGSDGKPIKATGDNVQNTFMCEIHNDIANPNASPQDIAEKTKQVLAQWYVQTVVPNIPTPN